MRFTTSLLLRVCAVSSHARLLLLVLVARRALLHTPACRCWVAASTS